MDGDTNLGKNRKQLSSYARGFGEMPSSIPSLLLINSDVISPMKVVFETAGQVICNKNEKLTVENSDMNKVTINIEYSEDKDNKKGKAVRDKPIRSRSRQDIRNPDQDQSSTNLSSTCLRTSPERQKCEKMQRKHSDLCSKIDKSCLDDSLTTGSMLNDHLTRRKSECPPVRRKEDKCSSEEDRSQRRKAKSIERVVDIEKSSHSKEVHKRDRKVSDDVSYRYNSDKVSGKGTANGASEISPHKHANIGLCVHDSNHKRRKSETLSRETLSSTFGCIKSPGDTEGAEVFKNSRGRDKESDTLLVGKSCNQQKSPKHGRKSHDKYNSESSPKKLSLNAPDQKSSSSSLHIPEPKIYRRKSETPSYNLQANTSPHLPYLRRQSEAPPALLLRSSPTPPTDLDEDENNKENKKDTLSQKLLEPDVSHSISESLNRLAIGKSNCLSKHLS